MNDKDKVIVALDFSDEFHANKIVEELGNLISFYKIGFDFDVKNQFKFIEWLIEQDKRVFLDFKYYGIYSTIKRAIEQVVGLGVTFISVYGTSEIIKAGIDARKENDLKILAIPCLSSEVIPTNTFLDRVDEALIAGCDGIVASGERIKLIRKAFGNLLLIVSPGIRLKDSSFDEHKRYSTPSQAITNGADYIVVGRPVINAVSPKGAVENLRREIEKECLKDGSQASLCWC